PSEVQLPPPLKEPIESLGKPRDAYICDEEECGFITISRDEIRKHCNQTHEWRSTKEDQEHWHHVYVQTFFSNGGRQRYFTVDYDDPDAVEGTTVSRNTQEDAVSTGRQHDFNISQVLEEWNVARTQHNKELEVVDGNIAKTDHSLWSKRTGYPQHLAGSNFKHLSHTDEQRTLAKELWDSIEMPYIDDGTRMDTLLKLIKSFIFATVRGDVFSSGLLHFMAVLCIDEEMGRLRDANRFSFILAGVVYCTRVFAVEAILPSAERDCQGEDDDKKFLETRERYLADGGYSPMSKMSMVTSIVTDAENILWSKVMWSNNDADRFSMPLNDLEDDPTWTKRGVHLAIAIGRVAVGEQFAYGYVDEIGEVEAPELDTDDPLKMSAGRGGEIGGNRYGVSVDVVKYMNDRSINTFRPLSEKWHRFLGLDSFNTSKGQKHQVRQQKAIT
ncbi:hypothetical protein D6D12_10783, partial [Aureobasidium pullulans]